MDLSWSKAWAMKQPLGGCEQQHKHRVKITGSEPVESKGVGDGWLRHHN